MESQPPTFVIGQITVKDEARWAEYRSRVPATLESWGAELVCRGQQTAIYSGECPHRDVVILRFPNRAAADGWFESAAYQALIPLRQQAAEVVLVSYEASL